MFLGVEFDLEWGKRGGGAVVEGMKVCSWLCEYMKDLVPDMQESECRTCRSAGHAKVGVGHRQV